MTWQSSSEGKPPLPVLSRLTPLPQTGRGVSLAPRVAQLAAVILTFIRNLRFLNMVASNDL